MTKFWQWFIFSIIVFLDQITKYLVLKDRFLTSFFPDIICNPYIAWGIPVTGTAFFIFWPIAIFILFFLLKKFNWTIFLIIVLAGAISNVVDRFVYGCVIDFIKIGSFPLFNLADSAITGGVIAFSLFGFKETNENGLKKNHF